MKSKSTLVKILFIVCMNPGSDPGSKLVKTFKPCGRRFFEQPA